MNKKKLYLLIDNAPIHKSKMTLGKIEKIGLEIIAHPLYSLDLAPSDNHLFKYLKIFSQGRSFPEICQLVEGDNDFFDDIPLDFFSRPINKLIEKFELCISLKGEYL